MIERRIGGFILPPKPSLTETPAQAQAHLSGRASKRLTLTELESRIEAIENRSRELDEMADYLLLPD